MARELKFTTSDLNYGDMSEDCYIDPSDDLFVLLGKANNQSLAKSAETYFAQKELAKKQGIRPGSPAWFALFK